MNPLLTSNPLNHYPAEAHDPFFLRRGAGGPGRGAEWSRPRLRVAYRRGPAEPGLRPRVKGRTHRLKIDSSPQQATVFWDAGFSPNPKNYGVAGYTPMTLKVPRGPVKVIVEMAGFKPQEQSLDVRKSQTLTFTLERAPAMARLDLQAGVDGGGAGGEVFIDGADKGTVPNSFDVAAGRHQVEVRKPGYTPFSEWVTLAEGEHRTRELTLARAEAPAGTLLVTSDAGGDVYLDGTRKDVVPAIIPGVSAGDHVIEVRKEGIPPWRQTVTVVAGQQVKVAATFGAAASGNGSLRIISNEPDVEIYVDGEDKGKAPITMNDIRPGEHIVGARKKGFKPQEQTQRVASNENAIVSFRMEVAPPDRPHAGLKVQSTIPNAEVFLDGSSLGRAPVDRNDLDPGKHYVSVHRDGYTDFKREIVLQENQAVTLVADLSATGSLRILSTPEGAEVRIDGELIGRTPVAHDVRGRRSRGRVPSQGLLRPQGDDEGRGGPGEGLLRRHEADPDRPVAGAGRQAPHADVVVRRQGEPRGRRHRRLRPRLPLVPVDPGDGRRLGPQELRGVRAGRLRRRRADPDDVRHHGLLAARALPDCQRGPLRRGRGTSGAAAGSTGAARSSPTSTPSPRWPSPTSPPCRLTASSHSGPTTSVRPSGSCRTAPPPTTIVGTLRTTTRKRRWRFSATDDPSRSFAGHRFYVGFEAAAALDRLTSLFFQFEFVPLTDNYGLQPREEFEGKYNQALIGSGDSNFYFTGGLTLKF